MQLFDLFEGRTNVVEQLRPFCKDPSLYIHFTDVLKLGVNPKTVHSLTPLGIYTYPLDRIFIQLEHNTVPYASTRKYIHLVRSVGNMLDLGNVSKAQFDNLYDRMISVFQPVAASTGEEDFYLGLMAEVRDHFHKPDTYGYGNAHYGSGVWKLSDRLATFVENRTGKNKEVIWNTLFRKLGYDGIVDRSGLGIIHVFETSQAVFLSTKGCKLIQTYNNDHFKSKDRHRSF